MNSKIEIAADQLSRIGERRIGVANSERSLIPPAARIGMSVERIAHLTGSTVEHVREVLEEVESGEG